MIHASTGAARTSSEKFALSNASSTLARVEHNNKLDEATKLLFD
jgi:hypothetical protein